MHVDYFLNEKIVIVKNYFSSDVNVRVCLKRLSFHSLRHRGKKGKKKGHQEIPEPLIFLVGDLGLEPRAFGSGDQRSIHLS